MKSHCLQLSERPSISSRKGKFLFIFPSRPYWFSGNELVYKIIKILEKGVDRRTLNKKVSDLFHLSSGSAEKSVEKVCDLLHKNSVLRINLENNPNKTTLIPDFQVNKVEDVLIIATTGACNLKCPHCYATAGKKSFQELTLKEIKDIIKQVAQMPWGKGSSQIGLTGGEIFMRRDALSIIDMVTKYGFKVFLSTNAILLNDKKIEKLSKLKNLEICVSLDGPDEPTHALIRGKGVFKPTVEAIEKLCNAGIPVGINMLVHRKNFGLIEKTLSLAASLGADSFNCLSLMRVGRANKSFDLGLLGGVSEHLLYRKLFDILRRSKNYYQLMKNSTFANQVMGVSGGVKSFYCGVGTNRALYVTSNGDLYPCPDTVTPLLSLGNLKTDRLKKIWEEASKLEDLRKLSVDNMNEQCAQCEVRYFCGGGCRGENYQVTGTLTSPHFKCLNIKKSIYEIMWILTEEPDFYREKVNWLYQKVKKSSNEQ